MKFMISMCAKREHASSFLIIRVFNKTKIIIE